MKEEYYPIGSVQLSDCKQGVPFNFRFWKPNLPELKVPLTLAFDTKYPYQKCICAEPLSAVIYLFALSLLDQYVPMYYKHRRIRIVEAGTLTGPIDYGMPILEIIKRFDPKQYNDLARSNFLKSGSVGIYCDLGHPTFFAYQGTVSRRFPIPEDGFWFKVLLSAGELIHEFCHRRQYVLGLPYRSHRAEAQAIWAQIQFIERMGHFARPDMIALEHFGHQLTILHEAFDQAKNGKSHLTSEHRPEMQGKLDHKVIIPTDDIFKMCCLSNCLKNYTND